MNKNGCANVYLPMLDIVVARALFPIEERTVQEYTEEMEDHMRHEDVREGVRR